MTAAARARVGRRRSAADEVRQDMQTLGDQGRLRQAAGARDDVLLQRLQRVRAGARLEFGERRMQPQQMIDRSAERRLAAVDQPLTGGQRAEMRSPDAVDESRLIGKRHAARRRAEDQRQTPARIGRHRRLHAPPACPAAPACASMSPAPTGVPCRKAIAAAASAVNPRPSGAPGGAIWRRCVRNGRL